MKNYTKCLTDIKEIIRVMSYIKHEKDDIPQDQDISEEDLKSIHVGLKPLIIHKLYDFVDRRTKLKE